MTTGTRRRMGVEERRQQLIGVALELFSNRSPDEVSIDEIAAAAGISRPSSTTTSRARRACTRRRCAGPPKTWPSASTSRAKARWGPGFSA
ncbi:TetR/AcrR family transcriptional regulator [Actinomadura keratinilytica]